MNMLDGLRCYSDAIDLIFFKNTKSYFYILLLNLVFFALILLVPSLSFYIVAEMREYSQAPIIAGMSGIIIYTLVNFPMMVLSQNIINKAEKKPDYSFKDIFHIEGSWLQIFSLGAGVNFVYISFVIAITLLLNSIAGTQTTISILGSLLIISIFISFFNYYFANFTNIDKSYKNSFSITKSKLSSQVKLVSGFFIGNVIISLVCAYLIYTFIFAMDGLISFSLNFNTTMDLSMCMMHSTMSAAFLIIFNTVNLAAKGILLFRLQEPPKNPLFE